MSEYKKCPECDGEGSWYGMAPHQHIVHQEKPMFIGSTKSVDKKEWPDNFWEDPEAPGLGVWSCTNCNGNGVVNLDGSIAGGNL